jgi:hypothetical protein
MCENTVTYYVPAGHDYKEVSGKCGQTGYHGDRLVCYDCERDPCRMAEIERHERSVAADNAWLRSAGWGEM